MAATKATKRSITKDYAEAFDGMRSYEKMRLGYIYGCLVIGFTCDGQRDPQVYTPTFHLHNLAKPFSTVSLAARHTYRPRNVAFSVRYDRHADVLPELVEYFAGSCPLVNASNRAIDLVMAHHARHLESLQGTVLYPNILEHEIPIYLLAYFGAAKEAQALAERTASSLSSVPEEQVYRFSGCTKSGWLDQLEQGFQTLQTSVDANIVDLKLDALEHYRGEQ